MFNSIKSYLWGSYAPTVAEPKVVTPNATTSSIVEASSLFEQTLNAATNKITEQLLPQNASIEQLQSSSHQLLPSLNEQHQEDELKKMNKECNNSSNTNEDTEDESEFFNDESWELLDLEKPSSTGTIPSLDGSLIVRDVECVNMSTLLARYGDEVEIVEMPKEPIVSVRGQKPLKVSFKTPDLVIDRESAIDQLDSAISVTKPTHKKNKKKKNKYRIPKVKDTSKEVEGQSLETLTPTVFPTSTNTTVLNYAQVLKPKLDACFNQKDSQGKSNDASHVKSLKRNRTVSTTSWSSGEESDLVGTHGDENVGEVVKQLNGIDEKVDGEIELKLGVNEVENYAINESIISSNFSDFDHRYQDINDFVLKPKKRRNKKQKRFSLVPSVSIPIQSNPVETSKKFTDENETGEATSSTITHKSNYLKLKRNKKNPSVTHSTSPGGFFKTVNVSAKAHSFDDTKSGRKSKKNYFNTESVTNTAGSSSPNLSSFGCTDCSDTPDMDESWFVTPPPCFTNVNKMKGFQSKLKHAHRENELIENPSLYFSSELTSNIIENNADKNLNTENMSGRSSIVASTSGNDEHKKLNKSKSSNANLETKKVSTRKNTHETNKKKGNMSCDNKFIVTNWGFDEQDDIDDFDNIFNDDYAFKKAPKLPSKRCIVEQISTSSAVSTSDFDESDSLQDASPVPEEINEDAELSERNHPKNLEVQTNTMSEELATNENIHREKIVISTQRRRTTSGQKKAPTPVHPIEPERRPGWQLKRKRRFLSSSMPLNQGTVKPIKDRQAYPENSPSSTPGRSSPSIIDRIGTSIVANFTNLTGDFTCASGVQSRVPLQEWDKLNNTALRKSNSGLGLMNRMKLSKGYLDRQNGCAKLINSKRREGRRLKMHKTFNGYSVDRKVQTNFHK